MHSRRDVLSVIAASVGAAGFGLIWPRRVLAATPSCPHDHEPTERAIEGPYFTPNSPERQVLRDAGTIGAPLYISGRVLGTDCRPIAGALVDVWNANGNGAYDNGYHLRGHQRTDSEGAFLIGTVKPGGYGPSFARRAPHIHVKVQGPKTDLLTTQLYFPGEDMNAGDDIFRDSLVMKMSTASDGSLIGRFDFALPPVA